MTMDGNKPHCINRQICPDLASGNACRGPCAAEPTETQDPLAADGYKLRAMTGEDRGPWDMDRLLAVVSGIDDDYMTSERHHPDYVLIPTTKFEAIRTAVLSCQQVRP